MISERLDIQRPSTLNLYLFSEWFQAILLTKWLSRNIWLVGTCCLCLEICLKPRMGWEFSRYFIKSWNYEVLRAKTTKSSKWGNRRRNRAGPGSKEQEESAGAKEEKRKSLTPKPSKQALCPSLGSSDWFSFHSLLPGRRNAFPVIPW